MVQIFKHEIDAGIADLVKASASISYCTEARNCKGDHGKISAALNKALAENEGQTDLYYLESILVSTGWNKNDDVFLPQPTWEARATPEDKQFNFMHDENDIIGHITSSYVIDKDGNTLSGPETPDQFDIVTRAVLYNSWSNPENKERMEQIIAEIEEGKWFVSMECLFAGFDYALISTEGEAKLLARNDESSFLTKHLRAYGGTGEFEGYKVGRALRQISFSGKGLVNKPANPRSIIFNSKSVAEFHVTSNEKTVSFHIGEKQMSDQILENQLAQAKAELEAAKKENLTMKASIEASKDAEVAAKISAFENTLTEKDEAIANLENTIKANQTRVAELEAALAKSQEELSAAMKDMDEMKKKEKTQCRKAALIEAGIADTEVDECLAGLLDINDESFNAVVAMFKKNSKQTVATEDDTTTTQATATEATDSTFDGVQTTEAALVDATPTNDAEKARAEIAKWLEEEVIGK